MTRPIKVGDSKVVLIFVLFFSDDHNIDFGTIICAMGVRYKSYCANIVRTLMVDPSDQQQKNYEFLLSVEDAILEKLKDGMLSCLAEFLFSLKKILICFSIHQAFQ